MQQAALDSDVTLRSRYECKYLVSEMMIPLLREMIHPFMQPDRFAAERPGHRYPISSLYLDSDDLHTYQQTVGGEKNRFKLRLRTYDDNPDSPVYFEVKRKVNNIVSKHRAAVPREAAQQLLEHRQTTLDLGVSQEERADLEEFLLHADLMHARPVVRVAYQREAYESRSGDPVRITVDTELRHAMTLDFDLSHESGRWQSTPVEGAIIEIKFTERFPTWVSDLIRALDLKQQPVPKYVLSLDHFFSSGRESAMSLGGLTLPPRRI